MSELCQCRGSAGKFIGDLQRVNELQHGERLLAEPVLLVVVVVAQGDDVVV
jgi:hypothetical protein